MLNIDSASTGGDILIDIDLSAIWTGAVLDIASAGAGTGSFVQLTRNAAVGAVLVNIDIAASGSTAPAFDIDSASTGADELFDIDMAGVWTGNLFTFATAAGAGTGDVFNINLTGAGAGAQCFVADTGSRAFSAAFFDINCTGAVTPVAPLFDIDVAWTGGVQPLFDIDFSGTWGAGNVFDILMDNTAITAQAIYVESNTLFSQPLVELVSDGVSVAEVLQITTAGVGGGAGVPAAIDVTGTGDLAAGSSLVAFGTSGSISATSYVLDVQQSVGAGIAGAYAVHISASGANVEGLHVDAGLSLFDEAMTATSGVTTGSGADTMQMPGSGASGIVCAGTMRPYKSVWIPADLMAAGASAGSVEATRNNAQVWLLDGAATESLRFRVAVPNGYADGTDVRVAIYAAPTTSAAGNVVWRVDFISIDTGTALNAGLTTGTAAAGLAQTGTAEQLTIFGHTSSTNASATSANLIVTGTTVSDGEYLVVEIVRLGADAGDTYDAADMAVYGVNLEFQVDSIR